MVSNISRSNSDTGDHVHHDRTLDGLDWDLLAMIALGAHGDNGGIVVDDGDHVHHDRTFAEYDLLAMITLGASGDNDGIVVDDFDQALVGYGYNDAVDDNDDDTTIDGLARELLGMQFYRMQAIVQVLTDQTRSLKLGSEWASFAANESFHLDFRALDGALNCNQSLVAVNIRHDCMVGMDADHRASLLLSIAKLPALRMLHVSTKSSGLSNDSMTELSPESVDLPALCFALQNSCNYLDHIKLGGLSLLNESHVGELAKGVGHHGRSIRVLKLEDIRVENVQPCMFDPILQAMMATVLKPALVGYRPSGLNEFSLTCCNNNAPDGPSLISADVLEHFLCNVPSTNMDLQGLGLTDEHCRTLRRQLGLADVLWLDLRRNPGIGQEGYEALAGIISRNPGSPHILVDDQVWAAKLETIRGMNRFCNLKSYLELGTFASRDKWVEFMCEVVESRQMSDAMKTASLYYTIREYPHLLLSA